MKTTIIPAQITTVEDKIAGNLSLTQIILLIIPVFSSPLLYMYLPPFMGFSWYKVIILVVLGTPSFILAIRIKGKIVLDWLVVIMRYGFRPKFYVFNKNDTNGRILDIPQYTVTEHKSNSFIQVKKIAEAVLHPLPADSYALNLSLQNPDYSIRFIPGQKGGLHVAFREAKN